MYSRGKLWRDLKMLISNFITRNSFRNDSEMV